MYRSQIKKRGKRYFQFFSTKIPIYLHHKLLSEDIYLKVGSKKFSASLYAFRNYVALRHANRWDPNLQDFAHFLDLCPPQRLQRYCAMESCI